MLEYFKQLILSNEKQLCFYAILSQQNFSNTLHTARDSNLGPKSDKKIVKEVMKTENISIQIFKNIYNKFEDSMVEIYLREQHVVKL